MICELGHVMEYPAPAVDLDEKVVAVVMACQKMVDNRAAGHQTPCSARATWRRSRKPVTTRKP